jgi:hypothetical protein
VSDKGELVTRQKTMGKKGSKETQPTVDPELTRQLDEADDDVEVQAVFTLTNPEGEKYRSNELTEQTVKKIFEAAKSVSETTTSHVKVFPNIQSFAVSAPASIVRSMLSHQEIASATANEQKEDLMIRPVPSKSKSSSESTKKKPSSSKRISKRKKSD